MLSRRSCSTTGSEHVRGCCSRRSRCLPPYLPCANRGGLALLLSWPCSSCSCPLAGTYDLPQTVAVPSWVAEKGRGGEPSAGGFTQLPFRSKPVRDGLAPCWVRSWGLLWSSTPGSWRESYALRGYSAAWGPSFSSQPDAVSPSPSASSALGILLRPTAFALLAVLHPWMAANRALLAAALAAVWVCIGPS